MTFENDTSPARLSAAPETARAGALAHLVHSVIKKCTYGGLTVHLPSNASVFHRTGGAGPSIDVDFCRWRGLWRGALSGHLGFAQGYIDGDWATPDLKALFDFCMLNESALGLLSDRFSPTKIISRFSHWLHGNSRGQSRRNIAAHYDLGNEFYAAWLDADMNYSSGIYPHPGSTLEEAQEEKLACVMGLMDLKGGEHVLEIGFGWGALAERLIRTGCRFTGLTLSEAQLAFAQRRLGHACLADHADLHLRDYRDAEGTFDRIVSIEMLEAVGEAYWPTFFTKLRSRLRNGGVAVLQSITIEAARFADYRQRPDFIQHYIFPGGMLPTVEIIVREAQRAGLKLTSQQQFGVSYARTLAAWRARFERSWPHITLLGFDEQFKRMWDFYFLYCQTGFESRAIDVGLYRFEAV